MTFFNYVGIFSIWLLITAIITFGMYYSDNDADDYDPARNPEWFNYMGANLPKSFWRAILLEISIVAALAIICCLVLWLTFCFTH